LLHELGSGSTEGMNEWMTGVWCNTVKYNAM
jgi:hypothetical protein